MHDGKGTLLVLSGGTVGHRRPEAAVMADMAKRLGIDARCLVLEEEARNTRENARFALALLGARGVARVIVVSDFWHLPRACMLFRRFAPSHVSVSALGVAPEWRSVWWWMGALREIPAFVADCVRGW